MRKGQHVTVHIKGLPESGWIFVGGSRDHGAGYVLVRHPSTGRVVAVHKRLVHDSAPKKNPSAVARAAKDYEEFHWGRKPKKVSRVKRPRAKGALTELGELTGVIYKTRKGKQRGNYEHLFEGRAKPILAMDAKRELHIVRGKSRYKVKEEGIVG